jgi:hypothetical protein
MLNQSYLDYFPKLHQDELMREAERERLANLARGPRRPLRAAIADWLLAAAERVDGSPHGSISRASARLNP